MMRMADGPRDACRRTIAVAMVIVASIGLTSCASQPPAPPRRHPVQQYRETSLALLETAAAVVEMAAAERGMDYTAERPRVIARQVLTRLDAYQQDPWSHLVEEVERGWNTLPPLHVDMRRAEWATALLDRFVYSATFELTGQVRQNKLKNDLSELVGAAPDNRALRRQGISEWNAVGKMIGKALEVEDLRRFYGREAGSAAPGSGESCVILAHMGAFLERPENSMSAFRRALEMGADGIECDLRLAGDGTVFVLHDSDLLRLTGARRNLHEMTREEVLELRLRDPRLPGMPGREAPAMLTEVLEELPTTATLWLELKPDESALLSERVGDLLAAHEHRNRIIVSSFSGLLLEPLMKRFPDMRFAVEYPRIDELDVEMLSESEDARRLIVSSRLASQLDPTVVEQIQAAGIETAEFAPSRFEAIRRAYRAGIGYIQTNRVDRAVFLRGH
jgi:glycerophosphoryl diester phosphodiesterase